MIEIPLRAIPNQSLSIRLADSQYNIRIHASNGIMSFDITRDGTAIVTGARAVAGALIIPSQYQEDGNFFVYTPDGLYPDYTLFGVSQSLVYITQEELGAIRGGT